MFQPGDVSIQKFGGSSMATPERIRRVAERIAGQASTGRPMAIVVSAMGDTTDDLISLMRKVSYNPDLREMDQMLATGEMISCTLMASALKNLGIKVKSFNAFNLKICSDEKFGSAEIKEFGRIDELKRFIASGGVAIVAGFQGITPDGDLTTLGRGGSDITAVALARDLGQKVCEKFTDEDGIYTADPRIISSARKIWHLNYEEMAILAGYGNGILHPRSISYAKGSSIRIHVRSSFTREEGTIVGPTGNPDLPVKSIACDKKQAIICLKGVKRKVNYSEKNIGENSFSIFELEEIYKNGFQEIRFGVRISEVFEALPFFWNEAVEADAEDVQFKSHLTVISIVGCGLNEELRRKLDFPMLLRKSEIPVIISDSGKNRVSIAVGEDYFEKALDIIHTSILQKS